MTETRIRIRWEPGAEDSMTAHFGMVGTCGPFVFKIIKPVMLGDRHTLTSELPGQRFSKLDGDPEELKTKAERWLEEFVSSLGAIFPDGACVHEPEGREIALDPAGED